MSASLPFRWRRPLLALVATALGLLVALLGVFVMGRSFPVRSAALAVGPLRALVDRPLTPDGLGAGGQASDLVLFDPMGITLGPDGAVYLSDRGRGNRGRVIWRIDEDGVVHHVAGSGRMGRAREGEPAADADLTAPEGLAFGPEGRLHFVDNRSNRVLRIEKDGTLSVVAGTGTAGFGGDGGPPTGPLSTTRPKYGSTPPEICSSPTSTTTAFGAWTRTASSKPSPGRERRGTAVMEGPLARPPSGNPGASSSVHSPTTC